MVLTNECRVFSFLCGHDSNLTGVLAALGVSEYELKDGIRKKTPIGAKLVFSKWIASDGEKYRSVDLVYQTPEQLRTMPILDLTNPPAVFHIILNGLEPNADGLYPEKDLLSRFEQVIGEYDLIAEQFAGVEAVETELSEVPAAVE